MAIVVDAFVIVVKVCSGQQIPKCFAIAGKSGVNVFISKGFGSLKSGKVRDDEFELLIVIVRVNWFFVFA